MSDPKPSSNQIEPKLDSNRVHEFKPMVIKQEPKASFDYKAAMMKLSEERVKPDDPRLVQIIKDYYLIPPSTEPYNLSNPYRMDYSMGQTPYIDSRLNYMLILDKAYQRSRVVHGLDVKEWTRKEGIPKNEVPVQCFPLYSLLLAMNQVNVDFFSLDVEGDELKVLQTIPWDKVNIKMLTVEYKQVLHGYKDIISFINFKGYDTLLLISDECSMVCDIILRKKELDH